MVRLSHYPGAGMEHPRILSVLYRCLLRGLAREHIGMATGSMGHGMRSKSRRIYSGKNYVTWGHCWAGKKVMAHYYNQADATYGEKAPQGKGISWSSYSHYMT